MTRPERRSGTGCGAGRDDPLRVRVGAREVLHAGCPPGRCRCPGRSARSCRRGRRRRPASGRPASGACRPRRSPGSGHRVAARVDRGRRPGVAAELAPVHAVEAGAVATGHEQHAVAVERQRPAGVARELLAPLAVHAVADEVQAAGGIGDVGREVDRVPVELAADDAAVRGGARRGGAGVVPDGRRLTRRRVVVVVEVDVRAAVEEVGVERDAQQAAVPEVVDVGADVEHLRRRRVVDGVVRLDDPSLLGDECATIGGEPHRRGHRERREDRGLGEVGVGERAGGRGGGRLDEMGDGGDHHRGRGQDGRKPSRSGAAVPRAGRR